jgi:predicted dehydrogenase
MKNYWVPGTTIGYEHTFINGFADFLASLEGGPKFQPDMRTAARTQLVCDKVLESAKSGQWIELSE